MSELDKILDELETIVNKSDDMIEDMRDDSEIAFFLSTEIWSLVKKYRPQFRDGEELRRM